MGTHIVYNLVTKKLGGVIRCNSEPGQGIEFIMIFPMPVGAMKGIPKIEVLEES